MQERTGAVLVKVVEGSPELGELLLCDALAVPRQDLVLHLVDVPVDGGQELFPAHAKGLHCVLGIPEIHYNITKLLGVCKARLG